MIPVIEGPKPTSNRNRPLQAIEYLAAERERSKALGVTEVELFKYKEEWATKSEEEKQLSYMDFAERYADYMCGYEKSH